MNDYLVMPLLLISAWAYGRTALHLAGGAGRYNDLSIAIGGSLGIIAVNLLYFIADLSIAEIRNILAGGAIASCCYLALRARDGNSLSTGDLIPTMAIYAFLALTALLGKEQYYVFRGNWWDHFTYVTAAFGFAKNSLSSVLSIDPQAIISQDLLYPVSVHYHERPTVMLLFSLLIADGGGNIFLRGFLYMSGLLAAAYPPLHLLVRTIRDSVAAVPPPAWLTGIIPVGFVTGFWGQYILDIDAWGQLGSLSFLLAFVTSYILLLREYGSGERSAEMPRCKLYWVAVILFAGSWFIYPENASIHLCCLVAATVAWVLISRPSIPFRSILWLIGLPFFSLLSALPNYRTTVSFLFAQAKDGLNSPRDWWLYFDSYIVGINDSLPDLVNAFSAPSGITDAAIRYWHVPLNATLSFFGLYFIPVDRGMGIAYPVGALIITLSIALAASFLGNLTCKRDESGAPTMIRLTVAVGMGMALYMLVTSRWWQAGKVISYFSPYVYLLVMFPLLINSRGKSFRIPLVSSLAAFALLVLSLGFGVARVYSSVDPDGIGYYRNYPSIQGGENKTLLSWDFDVDAAKQCRCVDLSGIRHPFYSHYLRQKLAYKGVPYYSDQPVHTYFGTGEPLGTMPGADTDCAVVMNYSGKKLRPMLIKK